MTAEVIIPAQKKHLEVTEAIEKEYSRRLASKYPKLTREQFGLISFEGADQRWPTPDVTKDDLPPSLMPKTFVAPTIPSTSTFASTDEARSADVQPSVKKAVKPPKRKPKTLSTSSPARIASNLFRTAKSYEVSEVSRAIEVYKQVIKDYPESPEAGMAAVRMRMLTGK
jgi:hypothetical protein